MPLPLFPIEIAVLNVPVLLLCIKWLGKKLLQFLVGPNEQYKIIRGNLIMMKPLPTLNQAYNVILQEKKQRGLNSVSQIMNQSLAFNAQENVDI